jgi:hypothetical protein
MCYKSTEAYTILLRTIFFNFHTVHFCSMFMKNQQMHWFLAVYYFILPLLHVSTLFIIKELFRACWVTCESNAMVDRTLRYTLLCVCYVEAWCAPICLVTLPCAFVSKLFDACYPSDVSNLPLFVHPVKINTCQIPLFSSEPCSH